MPVNDFLPFATDIGANVESQAAYASDPLVPIGNQPSTQAISSFNNKVLRQSSVISSQLAQYISNLLGQDVLDNGDLNALRNQIAAALATWTGAIDSTLAITSNTLGVKTAGITSTQLAAACVGTSQIQDSSVTKPKLSAANVVYSSTVSPSVTGTSFVDTGAAVTITTSGRPVWLSLMPGNSGIGGALGCNTAGGVLNLNFVRGSTQVAIGQWTSPGTAFNWGVGQWQFIDTPAAGTYTYKVQIRLQSGPGDAFCTDFFLMAMEM